MADPIPLKPFQRIPRGPAERLQVNCSPYVKWLIQQLKGTHLGSSESEVALSMIQSWLDRHEDWLKESNIWPPKIGGAQRPIIVPQSERGQEEPPQGAG